MVETEMHPVSSEDKSILDETPTAPAHNIIAIPTNEDDNISDSLEPTSNDEPKAIPIAITETQIKEPYKSKFATNLERFHFICKDLPSPDLFIDYNYYFMTAASLNRKVWIGGGNMYKIYPNLFLIFVAKPGLGKSMPASTSHRLLDTLTETRLDKKTNKYVITKLLNLGPDSVTFEKFVLRTHQNSEVLKGANGKLYHQSSTSFCLADEMGVLFTDQTKRLVSLMNKLWDCHDYECDTIKHGVISIKNPCVSFLGCIPPEPMHDLMRTKVLDGGFTARAMFIFASKKRHTKTIIYNTEDQVQEEKIIQNHLRKLAVMPPTEITYSADAYKFLDEWTQKRLEKNINPHPKLQDFNARRQMHLIKLAINRHYFDKTDNVVEAEDFAAAEKDLNKVEMEMHMAVSGSSDNPAFRVAENIKAYLAKNGQTTKQKLILEFYSELDIDKINDIFDFLISTEQCMASTLNNKPAINLINQ